MAKKPDTIKYIALAIIAVGLFALMGLIGAVDTGASLSVLWYAFPICVVVFIAVMILEAE